MIGRMEMLPGPALALVALFSGVASGVALKTVAQVPSGQAIALRAVLAVLVIGAVVVTRRPGTSRQIGPRGVLRAGLDALAALTFSLALFEIPLSLLAGIHATLPILTVILSGLLLKERLRPGNWLALALALAGTLLILQPGLAFSPLGIGLAIVSTLTYALRDVTTRRLPAGADTLRLALLSMLMVGMGAAAVPSGDWLIPSAQDLLRIALSAVGLIAANVLIIAAVRRSELGQIAPLRYTSVLWSLAFDVALWSYLPDAAGWAGIALILCAGLLQLHLFSASERT